LEKGDYILRAAPCRGLLCNEGIWPRGPRRAEGVCAAAEVCARARGAACGGTLCGGRRRTAAADGRDRPDVTVRMSGPHVACGCTAFDRCPCPAGGSPPAAPGAAARRRRGVGPSHGRRARSPVALPVALPLRRRNSGGAAVSWKQNHDAGTKYHQTRCSLIPSPVRRAPPGRAPLRRRARRHGRKLLPCRVAKSRCAVQ
jgi:hypothetical protein